MRVLLNQQAGFGSQSCRLIDFPKLPWVLDPCMFAFAANNDAPSRRIERDAHGNIACLQRHFAVNLAGDPARG